MEAITPWLTPALVVALFVGLRSELIKRTDKLDRRFDALADNVRSARARRS